MPHGDELQRACIRSKAFAKACRVLELRHIRTRLNRPRTNSKIGAVWPPADFVYIQTACCERASIMSFPNSEKRNRWLPRYLAIDNYFRKHSVLGWRSPQQRLSELLG